MNSLLLATLMTIVAAETSAPQTSLPPKLRSLFYKNHDINDFVDVETKYLVLTFLDNKCPLVPQVVPKLLSLEKKFSPDVRFLGIYVGSKLSVPDMARHAQDHNISFRVLLDHEQRLARLYGVTRLSETIVLDVRHPLKNHTCPIVYRGQIDDQMGAGNRKPEPTERFLEAALTQVTRSQQVVKDRTEPDGCLIQYGNTKPLAGITFHKDVKPILQRRCQSCHRPGEAGPMELVTYDDVTSYGAMVREVVTDRRMPPWPGHSPLPLLDDQRLSAREVATVDSWVQTGMAEGDPASGPADVTWPDPKAWRIGKPDLVVKTKPFLVPATGYLQYQYYLVPTKLSEDRFIQAIQVRTNSPQVVHHIQVLEGNPDPAVTEARGPVVLDPVQQIKLHGFTLEESKLLANYAPGNNDNAAIYPADKGQRLRKGSILFFETHYTTNGTETLEESEVGIVFRKTPPEREIQTQWFYRNRGHFKIPAGAGHAMLEKDDIFIKNQDVRVNSLRMHLHARGKSFLIEKVSPLPGGGERTEKILQIPAWDFNWQRNYYFAPDSTGRSPVTLLGGEYLRATAHWDNSRWNPSNPDPSRDVFWGQQTKDEMMAIMMTYEVLTAKEILSERATRGAK